jgi:hypothetical protein
MRRDLNVLHGSRFGPQIVQRLALLTIVGCALIMAIDYRKAAAVIGVAVSDSGILATLHSSFPTRAIRGQKLALVCIRQSSSDATTIVVAPQALRFETPRRTLAEDSSRAPAAETRKRVVPGMRRSDRSRGRPAASGGRAPRRDAEKKHRAWRQRRDSAVVSDDAQVEAKS